MIQKGSYNIRCNDGLKTIDGYIYTTSVQDEPMSFGITQYNDGWYVISELSSGLRVNFETNINLMTAVRQLKVFIAGYSERLNTYIDKALKKYGKANEVKK